LLEYTRAQCELHGIDLADVHSAGPIWDPNRANWIQRLQRLPLVQHKPVLLVPKYAVRRRLSLDSQEFYNHHMLQFLAEEYLQAGGALVHTLKNGALRVYKKEIKEHHPFNKNDIAEFVRHHPKVLEEYKKLKGAQGPLSTSDFDEDFDEAGLADVIAGRLKQIAAGGAEASSYHSLMIGTLSFLFYPGLVTPVKEAEIHEGRKRIDIRFSNSGNGTFFSRAIQSAQMRALSVPIECKNYSADPANPEIDQLSGRFSLARGFFGIMCCRSLDDPALMTRRCADTARDGRGYMLVLSDADIQKMLELVAAGNRGQVQTYLHHKLDDLIV
jgi:hypothetical protein